MKTAAGVTYSYDGDGRRVSKSSGKMYWYGSGGEILAETNTAGGTSAEYIFFGGKRIAMLPASGNAVYYAEDSLGSARVIVQSNGTLCYDGDFTPFGAERAYTNTCGQNYKFEGKERDLETQNDDFGARYYSYRFGRWLSSDWSSVPVPVPYANLANPQTLNLYSMVADDPESFADLDGHTTTIGQEAATACATNPQCANAQAAKADDKKPDPNDKAQKHHHHHPKPKPNTKKEVNKLYNEYSGIRPKPGATTESNRSQAVLNAAHVYNNVNGRGFQGSSGLGPQDARDINKPGTDAAIYYQDAKDAVAQAANEPDPTGGATHAYIYDPAALNSGQLPVQSWVANGETTTIEGPFINVSGGGDVPQGDEVYVITVKDPNR